jgi:hypothetical protein
VRRELRAVVVQKAMQTVNQIKEPDTIPTFVKLDLVVA